MRAARLEGTRFSAQVTSPLPVVSQNAGDRSARPFASRRRGRPSQAKERVQHAARCDKATAAHQKRRDRAHAHADREVRRAPNEIHDGERQRRPKLMVVGRRRWMTCRRVFRIDAAHGHALSGARAIRGTHPLRRVGSLSPRLLSDAQTQTRPANARALRSRPGGREDERAEELVGERHRGPEPNTSRFSWREAPRRQ